MTLSSLFRMAAMLVVVGSTGACSTAGVTLDADKKPVIVPLSEEQVSIVQASVTRALRDPSSAVFGDMKAAQLNDGRLQVCGMVNAKNGFGGYTGSSPFEGYLSGGTFTIEMMQADAPYSYNMCKSFGVQM